MLFSDNKKKLRIAMDEEQKEERRNKSNTQ